MTSEKDLMSLGEDEAYHSDDDLPADATKKQKAAKVWEEYATLASTHGPSHIHAAHSKGVVIFWCVVLFVCFICFTVLFSLTLKQYLEFNYSVDMSFVTEEGAFPAVTFCNLSPYSLSGMMADPDMAEMVNAYNAVMQAKIGRENEWNYNQKKYT